MITPHDRVRRLAETLSPAGLDVVGIASADAYDAAVPAARQTAALWPTTRSIVVFGSGGPALWNAFVREAQRDPTRLTDEPHPLDAYARRTIERADPLLGALGRRWFFAAAVVDLHLDFRLLASLAGLGTRSRLGLLMHPQHGTWLGLRAACFLDADLPPSPVVTFDPCVGCPGHCAEACPGEAFPTGTWDVDRCSAFHLEDTRCATTCHARLACPAGAGSRYPDDERVYHYDRAEGRRRLRATLGIADDRFDGEGPHWGVWRGRVDVKR